MIMAWRRVAMMLHNVYKYIGQSERPLLPGIFIVASIVLGIPLMLDKYNSTKHMVWREEYFFLESGSSILLHTNQ
jgi:hypothetical protein